MFFKTFAEKQIEQKGRAYDFDIRREQSESGRLLNALVEIERMAKAGTSRKTIAAFARRARED